MVEWETGEITDEPLSLIAADDPVTCAEYAKKHDLLHLDGWKRLNHIAKNQKQLARAINQSKIRLASGMMPLSFRWTRSMSI